MVGAERQLNIGCLLACVGGLASIYYCARIARWNFWPSLVVSLAVALVVFVVTGVLLDWAASRSERSSRR
jgi:hypothetical protein